MMPATVTVPVTLLSRPSADQKPVPHNRLHVLQLEYHDKPSGDRHEADTVTSTSRSWCPSTVPV